MKGEKEGADLLNVLPVPQLQCQPGGLMVGQTASATPGQKM